MKTLESEESQETTSELTESYEESESERIKMSDLDQEIIDRIENSEIKISSFDE